MLILLLISLLQAYRVLGHIDLLGDPLSLAQSYGKGMTGFVRGMAHGHVKKAAKELVQGVVGGNVTHQMWLATVVI
jgi:hypothetical protein